MEPAATTERPEDDGGPRLIRPLRDFLRSESAGGILLVIAAAVALVWANSPWRAGYHALWATEAGLSVGGFELRMDLAHWINDALMAVFFFVVGLEIKREVTEGELADPRKAVVPAAAAIGGMVVPAAIFVALTAGSGLGSGWGIPMATDIALAVGVLTLLGDKVPTAGKVFLLALAIVDDIGAILVIALVYSDGLRPLWLVAAAGCVGGIVITRVLRLRTLVPFVLLGVGLWLAFHEAGVHATLAGVICGLLAPSRPHHHPDLIDADALADVSTVTAARETVRIARDSVSVVEWLEHRLHPLTSFVVVPVFALANSGIALGVEAAGDAVTSPAARGVAAGLVVGKPLGITAATWLLVRSGRGSLPDDVSLRQVAALGCVAGIGFTVSLFVTDLAYTDEATTSAAKLAVLAASVIAGLVGAVAVRASAADPNDVSSTAAAPR